MAASTSIATTAAQKTARQPRYSAMLPEAVRASRIPSLVARLPPSDPTSTLRYDQLIRSMWHLVRDEPDLREASLTGAALFAGFNAFWSVLTLLLAGAPFHFGPQVAGLFGIVGAFGALTAQLAAGPQTNADRTRSSRCLSRWSRRRLRSSLWPGRILAGSCLA